MRVESTGPLVPRLLEILYGAALGVARAGRPLARRLGRDRLEWLLRPVERASKGLLFDCRMCGQCVLHATGMTCPMTCPKELRNGPCGGVRPDGGCEVDPRRRCTWVLAYERSRHMPVYGDDIHDLLPPLDWRARGLPSWPGEILGQSQDQAASAAFRVQR